MKMMTLQPRALNTGSIPDTIKFTTVFTVNLQTISTRAGACTFAVFTPFRETINGAKWEKPGSNQKEMIGSAPVLNHGVTGKAYHLPAECSFIERCKIQHDRRLT